MPDGLILTGGDRKLLFVAGGLSIVLIGLGILLSRRAADASDAPTTYSIASGGAKAAYLLLAASGYRVQRWEEPFARLPEGEATTLIVAEPVGIPTTEDRAALTRLVENGGTLVVTGTSGAYFAVDESTTAGYSHAIPDPIEGLTWERIPAASPSAITRAAPEITLAPQAYWYSDHRTTTLYGGDERPRVVKYERGRGTVIWWAAPTPLTNAGLREPGNLEFFLACVGDRNRLILWDEYFHDHRPAERAKLAKSRFTSIGGQLAIMVTAILLTYSRRSGPVVAPKPESRLSPLEFVRTLGAVYRRAAAASIAVDVGYQRFRYQLTQRLGIAPGSSIEQIERAAGTRWNVNASELGHLLRSCEAARSNSELSADAAMALSRALADWSLRLNMTSRQLKENG